MQHFRFGSKLNSTVDGLPKFNLDKNLAKINPDPNPKLEFELGFLVFTHCYAITSGPISLPVNVTSG